jgi:hypothetical protein
LESDNEMVSKIDDNCWKSVAEEIFGGLLSHNAPT